jgi:ribosomal-protein-serine acetyltransferase
MDVIHFGNYKIMLLESHQGESFFKLLDANRKRLEAFFAGTVSRTKTLKDTINYCKLIEERITEESYFPFAIVDKSSCAFIGLIDVKNIDWSIPKAEIGYFIDEQYEGKGIISEGLGLLVDYLIEAYQFKKLLCRANNKNAGSLKVALKNGFELEGTIRRDYKTTEGELVDLNYYGRIF